MDQTYDDLRKCDYLSFQLSRAREFQNQAKNLISFIFRYILFVAEITTTSTKIDL